ncbi:hypothetical protein MTX78_10585 [Hymenobacter tibetensis]|uniref:DUF2808 domain-containing protein n=1 Tax=Hymenobacter tibetensis TaxID=497967 RepID=A0ABY4D4A0_9BACT|nr:hypothetical protein [Hymenobacter tibetensis]UOG77027.1 hypothetical protein MTX78_10585 [Hymenobacter tibetensis]
MLTCYQVAAQAVPVASPDSGSLAGAVQAARLRYRTDAPESRLLNEVAYVNHASGTVQGQREFFAPRYASAQQQQNPQPDRRNLLHWQPTITLSPGATQELTFYTSDQAGRYLAVVQGLAADGQAGSTSIVLEVKPAL